MILPEAVLFLCRFLFDFSAMFLWGACLYMSMLVPQKLAHRVAGRLQFPIAFAIVIATLATAVMLPVRAATIGNGWADAVSIEVLSSVLWATTVGQGWIIQACCMAMLLSSYFVPKRRFLSAIAICAAFCLLSLTITGHAAMNDGWIKGAHRLNDALHLLAAGAWIGALAPVAMILRQLPLYRDDPDATLALMRFSTAGHVAVALVLVTGVVNSLLTSGKLPTDWRFAYQQLLSVKVSIVLLMVGLAIANRYLVVPRLRSSGARAIRWLYWGTITEIGLSVTVVGLVAWFGMLEPT